MKLFQKLGKEYGENIPESDFQQVNNDYRYMFKKTQTESVNGMSRGKKKLLISLLKQFKDYRVK